MSPTEADTKRALAILDCITQDIPAEKRKASYYTVEAAGLLGLKVGKGAEVWESLTEMERRDNLCAFLFLLRAPLETVSRGVRYFVRLRDELAPRKTGAESVLGDRRVPVRTEAEAWEEFVVKYLDPFMAQITPEAMLEAYEEIGKLDDHVPIVAMPPEHQKQEHPDPNS